MDSKEFDSIISARVQKCLDTLITKGREYGKTDRLHNFKLGAQMLRCCPERALLGFWVKHLVSVVDIVMEIERGWDPSEAVWNEKIGDTLCYAFLLDALVKERIKKEDGTKS